MGHLTRNGATLCFAGLLGIACSGGEGARDSEVGAARRDSADLAASRAAPAGLKVAMKNANRQQDILFEETRPGRTGNEILAATRAKLKAEGLDGTMYSHPIGMNGHGAGPVIGLWDYQEGVPGRGDAKVIPSMWFSSELQVTTKVPEWNGQPVRISVTLR